MRSTFLSLETARRALAAQQAALQTTSQNIANANTPGYSRQRVNLTATSPFTTPGMNNPVAPGQIGTGVTAGTVQRVRRDFLDMQYRGENTKYGYWQARSESLSKMEDLLNEPSDTGLSKVLDNFWNSLGDLADHPADTGARKTVRQDGIAVANTFHYMANSLTDIRDNIKSQMGISVKQINSLAEQINSLNKQISQVEPHGYLANDLYDKRDLLVDQLSQMVNVKVSTSKSGGESLDIADGRYTIKIETDSGQSFTLVDGKHLKANQLSVDFNGTDPSSSNNLSDLAVLSIGGQTVNGSISGHLQGLKESYNKVYPDMMHSLDTMALALTSEFNKQHRKGTGLDNSDPHDFFKDLNGKVDGAAKAISISSDIDNIDNIAASLNGDSGDNGNALKLADILTGPIDFINGETTSLQDYYKGVIGGMAVDAQQANRLSGNSLTLQQAADKRRQSVSGVSIDEEMVNLIKFQHAYSAAARVVTTVDQNLNRIINQMGLVGR